ncbi:SRPBCC family protein [Acrocarpospora catenulata]|uniref:SRPBCC family protein n=1 Tax=Acrocarpospora catenulata TaxID=2836182 RepID=UPI001BDB07B3|nr:SRPBCC domain-containing protein [Acrocarpospora catenulata]
MAHEFEVREELTLAATPDEVWAAIATGPGVDSWFMGRNEIEPREGGTARQTIMGVTTESTVTAWEPGLRYAHRTPEGPDGAFMAFEYLIQGREDGTTVLRLVHNGFLGDDWEAEYEALSVGDGVYLRKLAAYLSRFPGRTSAYDIFAVGPQAPAAAVGAAFQAAFGLSGPPVAGAPMRVSVDGLPPAAGQVLFATAGFLGAATDDTLYMLIHGLHDAVVVQHHSFSGHPEKAEAAAAWQEWLSTRFA